MEILVNSLCYFYASLSQFFFYLSFNLAKHHDRGRRWVVQAPWKFSPSPTHHMFPILVPQFVMFSFTHKNIFCFFFHSVITSENDFIDSSSRFRGCYQECLFHSEHVTEDERIMLKWFAYFSYKLFSLHVDKVRHKKCLLSLARSSIFSRATEDRIARD